MKIWIRACSILFLAGLIVLAAWWWSREPEQCALCSGPAYHAPLLINLSTGEAGPLTPYDLDPANPHELLTLQRKGTFSYLRSAGLLGYQDTATHLAKIEVPVDAPQMNYSYFCRFCRRLLSGVKNDSYVLADIYNLDNIQIYPITAGAKYEIRYYSVSIVEIEDLLSVTVYGSPD